LEWELLEALALLAERLAARAVSEVLLFDIVSGLTARVVVVNTLLG
jgi:hypothetical protein